MSDVNHALFLNEENLANKRMSETKDINVCVETEAHKKLKSDEYEEEDNKENNDNISTLSSIAKINENINKTRVDGLQTLYLVFSLFN